MCIVVIYLKRCDSGSDSENRCDSDSDSDNRRDSNSDSVTVVGVKDVLILSDSGTICVTVRVLHF